MTSTNTPSHDPTEPTDAAILAATERGDELFGDLVDQLEDEDDPGGVAYSVWISLTRLLATTGWSAEELARDAGWHAEHQGTLDAAGGTA